MKAEAVVHRRWACLCTHTSAGLEVAKCMYFQTWPSMVLITEVTSQGPSLHPSWDKLARHDLHSEPVGVLLSCILCIAWDIARWGWLPPALLGWVCCWCTVTDGVGADMTRMNALWPYINLIYSLSPPSPVPPLSFSLLTPLLCLSALPQGGRPPPAGGPTGA